MKTILKNIKTFMKFRIAFATGISASVGYLLSTTHPSMAILGVFLGAFFLAAGAASLNQVQEWKYDALMNRTKSRPLPIHFFEPKEGALISILLFIIGFSFLLIVMQNYWTIILGLSAFIMYNGIYTPMKRITAFATIPGALIGTIPPLLGWSVGNGNFLEPQLFSLMIFMFIWQIPHFYFLLFIYEDDYRAAGFPVLTDKLNKIQISRISFTLIFTLVITSTMLILTDINFIILVISVYLIAGVALLFRIRKMVIITNTSRYYRLAFMQLNMFVLLVLILVSLNKFLM